MTRKTQPKPNTIETLPADDAEQIRTWQRATGRKPGDETNAPHPYRAKLQHGIFANRIFGAEEMALFSAMVDIFREETAFNGSGDMVQLELFCIYCLKLTRALMAEQWDAVERLDRMVRSHMADLKLTKKTREGDGPADGLPSPLDYAMQLVERARQRQQELADAEAASEKTPETLQRTSGETGEAHA
ncbi:MAG: hypothetical protein ACYDBB_02670 [Armatimonadota bacterium]